MDSSFGWHKKLRKTDEFSSVFHFRCTHRGKVLDVSTGPNGGIHPRLGMIIPKKVLATAVARNRAKRLLREWLRQDQDAWAGLDIIARLRAKGSQGALDEVALKEDFFAGLRACQTCVSRRLRDSRSADSTANRND